ncbi:proline dehydrogenase [Paraoerskovia sediminicola]|uniref:L-glutamate gamma-semialdehyde dehydrogenase n=1 Tax=Paraoerskovia sediminicola TaxID=1138587 RepID=A0ABN6XGM2_9CELL|nr:bifunctional proline dehydrogenase/L-glutamate gamma-semialdehyde dehydrogenase [Paraoerskovia sediminicola]BDZ42812.1 proline dehydrogenase [Paraoerskovia sediminicola]
MDIANPAAPGATLTTPDDAPDDAPTATRPDTAVTDLTDAAAELAHSWIAAAEHDQDATEQATAGRLGALVSDPKGLELAVRFVDDVARPHDVHVAARELRRLGDVAADAKGFLGPVDRLLLRAGALVAPALPQVVVPAARIRLRQLVGHLVADAGPGLGKHLARTREQGYMLNVNLLGEAVLGEDEARARLQRTIALVERPDVDYVSVKVSSVVSQLVTWDLEGSRDRVVERLLPLYRAAREHGVFVNLDMEEYKDLALTTEVFRAVLDRDELRDLEAGIVLQAYLPDALGALEELTAFAQRRVAEGGAPIKVRLVKGANLAMEHVDAELHDWATAPYATKPDVDANYVRLIDYALHPDRSGAVRIGVASHNLFHVALAVLLGRARGVTEGMDIEMLQGMAPAEARAVRDEVAKDRVAGREHGGQVVLYTPVVADEDFDVAVSYLVRRLEENSAEQNFLHAMFADEGADGTDGADGAGSGSASSAASSAMSSQEAAFRASVALGASYPQEAVTPRRTARPLDEVTPSIAGPGEFHNAADTDPSVTEHRTWAQRIVAGDEHRPVQVAEVTTEAEVDDVVARAARAAEIWSQVAPATRAAALRAVARRLEEARTALVTAMVHEPRKTVAEADPEVTEAIDFANYYARSAEQLEEIDGATFAPRGVTLVTPPWNFPVAIPVGGILAALAAGSPAIAKPAPPTPRCLEVAVDAIHLGLLDAARDAAESGADTAFDEQLARDVVQYARVPDGDLGKRLVTHDGIARVVLTGALETAQMFAEWTPERHLFAETSGKNALVVTPAADIDLAVADLVRAAFGHAGQKCSAASLGILVGSVADLRTRTGRRFRTQLVDAVRSLRVGPSTDLGTVMNPLTEPASGKLLRALTTLEPGEQWLVRPRRLDEEGRVWTPGLKTGVAPGSFFHTTEVFGPVLGLMTAATLDDALELQNAVAFGLTGGIHSLDRSEIDHWLDRVEVGNAYINRHITGAIVQRQSFGGWKASAVGPGAKAGGPNYVPELGEWADGADVPDRDTEPEAWLAWAEQSDARAWEREFGAEHDPSGLVAESNVFRYRPLDAITVRVGAGARPVEVARVMSAARRAGVTVEVSRSEGSGATSDADFAASVADGRVSGRVRVVGTSAGLRAAAAGRTGDVTVLDAPVLASGRREILPMLREQAVSRTLHRFGHVMR